MSLFKRQVENQSLILVSNSFYSEPEKTCGEGIHSLPTTSEKKKREKSLQGFYEFTPQCLMTDASGGEYTCRRPLCTWWLVISPGTSGHTQRVQLNKGGIHTSRWMRSTRLFFFFSSFKTRVLLHTLQAFLCRCCFERRYSALFHEAGQYSARDASRVYRSRDSHHVTTFWCIKCGKSWSMVR